MMEKAKIENHGYLDNYTMYDEDLRPMYTIEKELLSQFV